MARTLRAVASGAMKLLAVCQADEPGGAELGLLRLARRLTARGWEVTLTTPSGGSLARSGYPWMSLDVGGLSAPEVAPPWADGDGPVVGFVGRIEPRKGVLDLVEAAPAIRAGGARVVIVGDDPYEPDSRYLAQVRASSDVEQPGWVDDAAGLMRSLDVLVAPSHQEPFGTVLAEAMAVGTPVVATRVGGLAEVVEDGVTGRLVDPGDPVALAAAVGEVLARRGEMSAAARAHAQRFGADAYADRVEELIRP